MSTIAERRFVTWLFNPFVYLAGGRALGIGLGAILLAGLLGFMGGAHFDGVLDMHAGKASPLAVFFAEGVIDWLILSAVLLVIGKILSGTAFRVIDLVGTQALARWPTILMAALTLPPAFANYSHALIAQVLRNPLQLPPLTPDGIYFFTATLLMLPLLVWMIALMYNAYAVSCNLRGFRAGLSFTAGLFLAELLSKIALYILR